MINNSSNLQKIISYIGGFDALGDHPSQIDTQKEYNLLSQYLNGSYQIEGTDVKKLKKSEQKDLKKLLNQLNKKWGNPTEENSIENVVTRENVKKYIEKYEQLINMPNKHLTEDELELSINKVSTAIEAYMKEIGIQGPYNNIDYRFLINRRHEILDFTKESEKNSKITLEYIKNPPSKEVLETKVNEFLTTNKLSSINTTIDTGDGDFTDVVHQKTNVCWALAGINTLAQSKVGLSLLENNLFRDEKSGVYAIRLKEAENYDLPSDGIYIITPQEIIDASQTIAEGEGDSVAYLLAIDKYFEELKTIKPEIAKTININNLEDGNTSNRFFEIITGGQTTLIGSSSYVNKELPKGIYIGNGINYYQIGEIVQSGRGAAVLSADLGIDDIGHALSVVGVKNGKLVIQESGNNQEDFLSAYKDYNNRNIFELTEPINGAPAYTISKDNFTLYTSSRSVLRWE